MKNEHPIRSWVVIAVAVCVAGFAAAASAEDETPTQAGEQVGIEGTFVRVATNDEGWVVVGYRIANDSVGEEWMLLDVGMTLTGKGAVHTVARDDIKLVTPGGQVLSLPTQEEFEKVRGSLMALVKRAAMVGDSINYFPSAADRPCSLRLFTEPGFRGPVLSQDEVDLDSNSACVGRIYFQVPGGIQLGNYNLDVKFASSIVKVPMEIMTEERAKEFTKQWKEAEKAARKKN